MSSAWNDRKRISSECAKNLLEKIREITSSELIFGRFYLFGTTVRGPPPLASLALPASLLKARLSYTCPHLCRHVACSHCILFPSWFFVKPRMRKSLYRYVKVTKSQRQFFLKPLKLHCPNFF